MATITKLFDTFAPMEHVLDSPAWNALISGNKQLANGSGTVRYFDKEVSLFAALEENSTENFQILHEMLPHNGPVLFITPVAINIPGPWKVLQVIKGLQMVYDNERKPDEVQILLTQLTAEHVPQMLALTKLTNPGPFADRTIDFGHYYGIFQNGELAAMAGQRMHPFGYAEISAVCTHPAHTGKGYARQLLLHQVHRIRAAAETPFLHVRRDNERAIKVYQNLGFAIRREVCFYVLQKGQ